MSNVTYNIIALPYFYFIIFTQVITHAGNAPGTTAVLSPTTEQHVTNTGSYSINGILGIEQVEGLHNGTPTGLKRKRHEDQGEWIQSSRGISPSIDTEIVSEAPKTIFEVLKFN